MKTAIKKIMAVVGIIAGALILGIAVFFTVMTVLEYRPEEVEALEILGTGKNVLQDSPSPGEDIRILNWNIGYASLDASQDFFMDGGRSVKPKTDRNVHENLKEICSLLASRKAGINLLQEVDIDSGRSYHVNQTVPIREALGGYSAHALNFKTLFVPFPVPNFIGKVSSGLFVQSSYSFRKAERISLPVPFTWPVRTANMKRCLLAFRIPLKNSGAELVIVNLHLEAYDDSGGREAQTRVLLDFLEEEYARGNYCIAGGDFNQSFPGADMERFPVRDKDYFVPGLLSQSLLKSGWRFASDTETPSCRLLNKPYSGNPDDTQYYFIDGFILSPNIVLRSVKTLNLEFRNSDHNPVELEAGLEN
ncbi:MAG: endonuclease/exonuclease/phosphatase family protein [Treponema sp.]|jgi:endonuclease/exonuclease/phosphatase family metal-dependent hydrolase|nr:endonuclease/exonuclease/phosphatase family protein [Treponema sp.]